MAAAWLVVVMAAAASPLLRQPACAQQPQPAQVSSAPAKPDGGDVNPVSYGARCDGVTDDAPAFNAALNAIRARPPAQGPYSWPIGRLARLTAPRGSCVIRSSLNMTGLYGAGFVADLGGTALMCESEGAACVDATGLGNATISGLTVAGSCQHPPRIGLILGRITNDHIGADHNRVVHPTITGCFLLAPFFNNQSETTLIEHAWFTNQQPNAYGAVWDGANTFNVQSTFTGKTYPPQMAYSFNENTCVACIIGTTGKGSVPIYIGASARHSFVNGYAFYSPTEAGAPGPALILDATAGAPDFLDLDVHFEDNGGRQNLTSIIEIRGPRSPVLHGLRLRDNYPEQSGPIFSRGTGVVTVTVEDADIQLGRLAGHDAKWWDDPAAWRVAGRIYSEDGTYIPPASFTGQACVAARCSTSTPTEPTLAVLRPLSGAILQLASDVAAFYITGSAPLSAITLRLPPLTGRLGQQIDLSFGVAVKQLTVQDSEGKSVSDTSVSAIPASTHRWKSLGAVWVQVQ